MCVVKKPKLNPHSNAKRLCASVVSNRNLLSTNAHTHLLPLLFKKTNIKAHTNASPLPCSYVIRARRYIDILYCFCIKQNHASFSSIRHIIITSHNPSDRKRFSSVSHLCIVHVRCCRKKVKSYRKPNNTYTSIGICGNSTMLSIVRIFSFGFGFSVN